MSQQAKVFHDYARFYVAWNVLVRFCHNHYKPRRYLVKDFADDILFAWINRYSPKDCNVTEIWCSVTRILEGKLGSQNERGATGP